MTKLELTEQFALFDGFESKAQAKKAFDYLISLISKELSNGNGVALGQDFGQFEVKTQAGKKGTSPSGVAYTTPPKKVVKFKASAPLKRLVAGE